MEEDILLAVARLKGELERVKCEYVHPLTHAELLRQKDEEIRALHQLIEHHQRRAEHAVADLKKWRSSKCVCCLYAGQTGPHVPCRDCQSAISNYGDAWIYKEPL